MEIVLIKVRFGHAVLGIGILERKVGVGGELRAGTNPVIKEVGVVVGQTAEPQTLTRTYQDRSSARPNT